jgi:hypothetical protein
MTQHDPHRLGGRSALERLGAQLAARDAERETLERLKVARAEARRDRAADAIQELRSIMGALWERVVELAPMTLAYSPNRLELEQAMLEWDVEHEFVHEDSFERSEWDVYAGAWIRLHQSGSVFEYPGCSSSLWYAKLPGETSAAWHEVAYNATEGNGPAEEPFALKDLIKADLVASHEPSNLYHALEPERMDEAHLDEFFDRWMGLLAAAAIGDLERPVAQASEQSASHEAGSSHRDAHEPAAEPRLPDNRLFGRLRDLGN